MKILIKDRIRINENDTYFEPKNLHWKEQISVGFRMFIERHSSIQKKKEKRMAIEYQEHAERVENLKIAIIEQINKSLSTKKNKLLKNKPAMSVTLSISREFNDVINEVLKQKEFDGYIQEEYIPNEDILKVYPELPILVKFTKITAGIDEIGKGSISFLNKVKNIVLLVLVLSAIPVNASTVSGIKYINQIDSDSYYKINEDIMGEIEGKVGTSSELVERFIEPKINKSNITEKYINNGLLYLEDSIKINKNIDIISKEYKDKEVTKTHTLTLIYIAKYGVIPSRLLVTKETSKRKIGELNKELSKTKEYIPVGYTGDDDIFDFTEGDYNVYLNPLVYEEYLKYFIDNKFISIEELNKESKFTKEMDNILITPIWSNEKGNLNLSEDITDTFGYSWKLKDSIYGKNKTFELEEYPYFVDNSITYKEAFVYLYNLIKEDLEGIDSELTIGLDYEYNLNNIKNYSNYNKTALYTLLYNGIIGSEDINHLSENVTLSGILDILVRVKDIGERLEKYSINEEDKELIKDGFKKSEIKINYDGFKEPETLSVKEYKISKSIFSYNTVRPKLKTGIKNISVTGDPSRAPNITEFKTSKESPQPAGISIDFNTKATGTGKLEYKYTIKSSENEELVLKNFSEVNEYSWLPTKEDSYTVSVYVRDSMGFITKCEKPFSVKDVGEGGTAQPSDENGTSSEIETESSTPIITTQEKLKSKSKEYVVTKYFPNIKGVLYKSKSIGKELEELEEVLSVQSEKEGYIVEFKISAGNDVRALALVDSGITYKAISEGKSWQTVTKLSTDNREITYIASKAFRDSDSEVSCIAEKLLKNTLTGNTALLLEDNDTALIGNRVIKTTEPMIINNSDETYYNLEVIKSLLTNVYVSKISPDTLIKHDKIPGEMVADVRSKGGVIEKTVIVKPDNIVSGNLDLVKNTGDFFNLDMTARSMTSMTREYELNGKKIYAVVEWSYAVTDTSSYMFNLSTLDNDNFSVKEASEYLFTRPEDENESEMWDINIGLSDALCNCLLGTKNKKYFTSGFLKPNVTLLYDSEIKNSESVIRRVFGNIDISGNLRNKYKVNASNFYTELFGTDGRYFDLIAGKSDNDYMVFGNMYFTDTKGSVYKNATQDDRVNYDTAKHILTVNTRAEELSNDNVVEGTVSINGETKFGDQVSNSFRLYNNNNSAWYQLVSTVPVSGLLDNSSNTNWYIIHPEEKTNTLSLKINSLINSSCQALGVPDDGLYIKKQSAYFGNTVSSAFPSNDLFEIGTSYLAGNSIYKFNEEKNVQLPLLPTSQFYKMFDEDKSPYITKTDNLLQMKGETVKAFPCIYLRKQYFSVQNGSIIHKDSNPYLNLGNVFYSGLNSTLTSRMLDNQINSVNYSKLPKGSKVLIGDFEFKKGQGNLTSEPYYNHNLVTTLANATQNDDVMKSAIGNLFVGLPIYYSGRTVPFVDYIKEVGIGNYEGKPNENTLIYRNGNKNVINSEGVVTGYDFSPINCVSIELVLDDSIKFYCIDPTTSTYAVKYTTDELGSGYISNISMFSEDLGFIFSDDDVENLVGNNYVSSPTYSLSFQHYKDRYNKALKGDIVAIFQYFFVLIFLYIIIISWICYMVLKFRIGLGFLLIVRNPTGVKGAEGFDIVKILTLGVWNLDTEPNGLKVFFANLLSFILITIVINADIIIKTLFY